MAPEQLTLLIDPNSPVPTDLRPSDVFSFGVMLFELLTGCHPFGEGFSDPGISQEKRPAFPEMETARITVTQQSQISLTQSAATLLAAQRAGPRSLVSLNPRVPRAIRKAIERCLSLNPSQRLTADELSSLFTRMARSPLLHERYLRSWDVRLGAETASPLAVGFGGVAAFAGLILSGSSVAAVIAGVVTAIAVAIIVEIGVRRGAS